MEGASINLPLELGASDGHLSSRGHNILHSPSTLPNGVFQTSEEGDKTQRLCSMSATSSTFYMRRAISRLSWSRTVDLSMNRRHPQCQATVNALCTQTLQMRLRNSILGAPPSELAA